jgi:hypothetical protein
MSLSPICESILQTIDAHGGSYSGTIRLVDEIPAARQCTLRSLQHCQHAGLICSSHSHGGRGHKSVHRLTKAGRYVLTQKGREHVRSK